MSHDRRRMAVEVTVERMNVERAAMGLPVGYQVGTTTEGVPCLTLVIEVAKVERVRAAPRVERMRIP